MRLHATLLAALLGTLVASGPVAARDRGFFGAEGRGHDAGLVDRRSSSPSRSRMTAAQAAREAQQRYGGGKVLSVDSTGEGFHVKLLRNGDVRVVFIADR